MKRKSLKHIILALSAFLCGLFYLGFGKVESSKKIHEREDEKCVNYIRLEQL